MIMTRIYTNSGDNYYLAVNEKDERTRYYFNLFTKEDVERTIEEEGETFEWCE